MNIQGPNITAGIAGTSRAQSRGADTENQQGVAASASVGESANGKDDQISIDPSGKSGDRGGDGHEHYHPPKERVEDESEEQTNSSNGSPSIDGSGEQLDLEA